MVFHIHVCMYIDLLCIDCLCAAATVVFGMLLYNVREDSGFTQLELFLSNPASYNITMELFGTDGSATGDQYIILFMRQFL